MEVLRTIAPPVVVLGFYPLVLILGEFWGGPDIPAFLKFVWSLALAIAVVKMYRDLRSKA